MSDPLRRRHLPVIPSGPESVGPSKPTRLLGGIGLCAIATLVLWAPLAVLGQFAGRTLAGSLAPGLDPASPAAWLERASAPEKAKIVACLLGPPVASFLVAGVVAGWLTARWSSPTKSRHAGSGVVLAGVAIWVLASIRLELSHALASLVAACVMGYASGWLGHWSSRILRTDRRESTSHLDDPASER